MSDVYAMIGFVIGTVGLVIIPIIIVVVLLPWLINSIAAFKLAKEAGYEHPGFAFIPVGCIKQMVVINALGGQSGGGPKPVLVNVIAILSCAMTLGFIPVVGVVLSIVAFVMSLIMWIFMIMAIHAFTAYTDTGFVGPLLCYLFIPIFGFAIMCGMLRKRI